MPALLDGHEYSMVINSSSGYRLTQGFRVRRVRVLGGERDDGRLKSLDLSDPQGPKEKMPYLTSIIEINGVSTGNRPIRDGSALKPGDYVVVDPKATVDGEAKVSRILDCKEIAIRTLLSKTLQIVPAVKVRKTTKRKLEARTKNTDDQGRTIRKSRRL